MLTGAAGQKQEEALRNTPSTRDDWSRAIDLDAIKLSKRMAKPLRLFGIINLILDLRWLILDGTLPSYGYFLIVISGFLLLRILNENVYYIFRMDIDGEYIRMEYLKWNKVLTYECLKKDLIIKKKLRINRGRIPYLKMKNKDDGWVLRQGEVGDWTEATMDRAIGIIGNHG